MALFLDIIRFSYTPEVQKIGVQKVDTGLGFGVGLGVGVRINIRVWG